MHQKDHNDSICTFTELQTHMGSFGYNYHLAGDPLELHQEPRGPRTTLHESLYYMVDQTYKLTCGFAQ